MPDISSFEAQYVPRFQTVGDDRRRVEALCGQRTFWGGVNEILSRDPFGRSTEHQKDGPVVELRLVSELSDRRSRIVVNVKNVDISSNDIRELVHSLPAEYGWRERSYQPDVFDNLPGVSKSDWYIARLERRLNYLDLPWRLTENMDTSGQQDLSKGTTTNSPFGEFDELTRRLVTEIVPGNSLETERFCVPVSGGLEIDPRSLRFLFQELQSQAPCVVSIAIAAVDSIRLNNYRRIAMLWSAYLKQFSSEIANAQLSSLASLQFQYDRFLLPDRQLCTVSMRVAAPSSVAAHSVALHLSARLGGLRSFKIRQPRKAPLENIGDPWLDVPHRFRWTDEWWEKRRKILHRELALDNIDLDVEPIEPVFEDFLIELPHLYTIDEAAEVAALPIADDDGLPGMQTKLLPPFSEPSRKGGVPLSSAPPADRIRIGVSAAAVGKNGDGDIGLTQKSGEWHTLSKADLTKHAFIVGSTGSGKTITTLFLVRELVRLQVPFLIIEPVKTEYFQHLKKIRGASVKRFRLEGTSEGKKVDDFLAFDPMRLQEGVSVARHASYLKSCFEAAFPMAPESAEAMMLEAGIRSYYTEDRKGLGCGFQMFTRGGPKKTHYAKLLTVERPIQKTPEIETEIDLKTSRSQKNSKIVQFVETTTNGTLPDDKILNTEMFIQPSLSGFRKFFSWHFLPKIVSAKRSQNAAELLENWRQFFDRRFEALATGMIGFASRAADEKFKSSGEDDLFGSMLEGPTIVELDGIPDDEQKALMMGFLTAFLFERRQAEDLKQRETNERAEIEGTPTFEQGAGLRHVLFLEEAHRILANSALGGGKGAQGKSVSLFVDMLAEIRAYGQGLVIVEQIPTKIVPEAVKNTNLKIMLRLTAFDDREFLGTAMNFTEEQKRFVTSLSAEEGRGVDMVVFEQQLDQPRLLTLPLPASRETPVHASLFEGQPQ